MWSWHDAENQVWITSSLCQTEASFVGIVPWTRAKFLPMHETYKGTRNEKLTGKTIWCRQVDWTPFQVKLWYTPRIHSEFSLKGQPISHDNHAVKKSRLKGNNKSLVRGAWRGWVNSSESESLPYVSNIRLSKVEDVVGFPARMFSSSHLVRLQWKPHGDTSSYSFVTT